MSRTIGCLVTIFIMLAATCYGSENAEVEKSIATKWNMQKEQLFKECVCFAHSDCSSYVECMERTECSPWFVDIKNAYKSIECEAEKVRTMDCAVGVSLLSIAFEKTKVEQEDECFNRFSDEAWDCQTVKENQKCLTKFVSLLDCGMMYDIIEKGVCSGKTIGQILNSGNLAKLAGGKQ